MIKYILIIILLLLLFGCKEVDEKYENTSKPFPSTNFEASTPQPQPQEKPSNGSVFLEPDRRLYRWYDREMGVACYGWPNTGYSTSGSMAVSCVKVN